MTKADTIRIEELRAENDALAAEVADLKNQNADLREAVAALMEVDMPRVLLAPSGIMIMQRDWLKGKP